MLSFVFLLKGSLPRAAPAALVLCWPQTFKELAPGFPSLRPLFRSESGCKSTAFFITRNTFFLFFENFLYYTGYQMIKNNYFFGKAWHLGHGELFLGLKRHFLVKALWKTFMFLK